MIHLPKADGRQCKGPSDCLPGQGECQTRTSTAIMPLTTTTPITVASTSVQPHAQTRIVSESIPTTRTKLTTTFMPSAADASQVDTKPRRGYIAVIISVSIVFVAVFLSVILWRAACCPCCKVRNRRHTTMPIMINPVYAVPSSVIPIVTGPLVPDDSDGTQC